MNELNWPDQEDTDEELTQAEQAAEIIENANPSFTAEPNISDDPLRQYVEVEVPDGWQEAATFTLNRTTVDGLFEAGLRVSSVGFEPDYTGADVRVWVNGLDESTTGMA